MRLLDDKGKFLGIINPFDALAVLSVVAILAALGWVFVTKGQAPLPGVNSAKIEATFLIVNQRPEVTSFLHKGDRVKDEETKADLGEIVKAVARPWRVHMNDDKGQLRMTESPLLNEILLTVRADGRASESMVSVNGAILAVGKKFKINTRYYHADEALLVGLKVTE